MVKTEQNWFTKVLAFFLMSSTALIFFGVSIVYGANLDWIDTKLGLADMRASEGRQWLEFAIGEGIEVDAQLAVAVVEDIPARLKEIALQALYSVISNIIQSIADLVLGLLDEITKSSEIFASISSEITSFVTTMQVALVAELESRVSSLGIVQRYLGDDLNRQQQAQLGDALSRFRVAAANCELQDPLDPIADRSVPCDENLAELGQDIVDVGNQAANERANPETGQTEQCTGQEFSLRLIGCEYGGPGEGEATLMVNEAVEAAEQDVEVVEQAVENIQNQAPADCRSGFYTFDEKFNSLNIEAGESFVASAEEASQLFEPQVLTPDECSTLQSSAEFASSALGVDTPTPENFGDVLVQALEELINSIVQKLLDSILALVDDFLQKALAELPSIVRTDFRNLVGEISRDIRREVRDIEISLT